VNDELLDFESDDEETNDLAKPLNWAEYGFIKTLCILMQLSGCPMQFNLPIQNSGVTGHYKLQCRAGNEQSTDYQKSSAFNHMLDNWFSALMLLSAEKNLLESLAIYAIINHFARCSSALQK